MLKKADPLQPIACKHTGLTSSAFMMNDSPLIII